MFCLQTCDGMVDREVSDSLAWYLVHSAKCPRPQQLHDCVASYGEDGSLVLIDGFNVGLHHPTLALLIATK